MELENLRKEITMLKRRRGVIKGSLTRIRSFIRDFNPRDQPISLIEFRQDELPQINKKFDEVQSQIELITEEFDQEEEERNSFEIEYFNIRSQIQELVNMEKGNSSSIAHNISNGTTWTSNRARLAPISLPSFNGDIQEWASFFDCFSALVHNDDSYSPTQKFHYLRTSLCGQALDMIRAIPMTEANYDTVVERLKRRYGNKGLVIQSHIRAILDSPHVKGASASELQRLNCHISSHVASLNALGQPVDQWDAWLVTIIMGRLDIATAQAWQLSCQDTELQKYEDLENFLVGRCTALETTEAWKIESEETKDLNTKKHGKSSNMKKALVATDAKKVITCVCCSENHRLYHCEAFKKLEVAARKTLVRQSSLCFNCLGPFHAADACRSKYSCQKCKLKHNTLLHYEVANEAIATCNPEGGAAACVMLSTPNTLPRTSLPISTTINHVFLATALVTVKDRWGGYRECRAVLDSGSQINFVSKRLANILQLNAKPTALPIRGIGGNETQARSSLELKVKSRLKDFSVNLICHILPVIINELPPVLPPASGWKFPIELASELADPNFCQSGPIDLLIGGGTFFELMEAERIPLGIDNMSLQSSKFGWIVTGEMKNICLLSMGKVLEDDWWAIQNHEDADHGRTSKNNQKYLEEQQMVQHFIENTIRNEEGRFVVRLPLKGDNNNLGESLAVATSRFLSIERRLMRDSWLKEEYVKFMTQYLGLGHMQEVQHESNIPERSWYLPHHAVIKASSITTVVRVVFDASAKGSNGISLNEALMNGPKVQEDLFSILVRFRKHQYALTSDIEKMYRQISVDKNDWDLQRILWRADPSDPLRTYRLTTITYGTTPAAFLATQCLVALAEQWQGQLPKAAKTIQKDFYMDDLMTGADTEEDCYQLQRDISIVMDSAKLPLRKWCSSSETVLKNVRRLSEDPFFTLEVKDDDSIKSLGLEWQPAKDMFRFRTKKYPTRDKCSKRTLLSDLNRIFDPLGFLSPVLLQGKIFLQQIWAMQVNWDCTLSTELQKRWKTFYEELEQLESFCIPRKVIPSKSDEIQIHGFCDASQNAYGACLYVRSRDKDGKYHSRLLCSKTRVAPLRGCTIPRLELCGALLLVELAQIVANSWELEIGNFRFWTDSSIVLGWLSSQNKRLKTYVANRVNQIVEISNATQWKHVRSEDNPADVASRGIKPREIITNMNWWSGPSWLTEDESKWIPSTTTFEEEELPEQQKIKLALVAVKPAVNLVNVKSTWRQLVRAIAWLSLFVNYLKGKKTIPLPEYLTVSHLKEAERILIKQVQDECFPGEIQALKDGRELPHGSKLKSLCPFLQEGLLLVGGRLQNANIGDSQKHSIVLPASHRVTRLIFESYHQEMLHCEPQALLAQIRRRYWPLLGRVMARAVARKCVKCVKANPKLYVPLMAPLPKDRVHASRPFSVTGIDFAGPFVIRSGIRRVVGKKAWIAVLICFATRAVHLEVVEDMTSEAFLACLRRFMARRGRCATIYSDNGTNFVGAARELAAIVRKGGPEMANEGIEWRFSPPSGPHFGGVWEAAVKSAKYHLKRVMGETKLTITELNTLICQIEACLNSRPITPMSSDPSEPEALTPAHFLVGGSLMLPPELDLSTEEPGNTRRWKHVQLLLQGFWRRWYAEYLPQMQIRLKWTTKGMPAKKGDVVIIKDECLPPARWKLGLVIEVHSGRDGDVRVVTLRLGSGAEIRRPVVKLCRLPTDKDCVNV